MSCGITTLEDPVMERETVGIKFTFKDSTGSAVTPNSDLKWTLVDETGSVVNNRDEVSITPSSSVIVVLADHTNDPNGDDTALSATEAKYGQARRRILITGTYNDSQLGTSARLSKEAEITICNTLGQT